MFNPQPMLKDIINPFFIGFDAMSIAPENFEQAMIIHMVRRLPKATWKISDWYQVRMSLDFSIDLSALSKKLEPQIYELCFLRDEVRYFQS